MSTVSSDPAVREVQALASSLGAPPPPGGLRARRRRPRAARLLIAAAAVLALAAASVLLVRTRGSGADAGSDLVVVESLRVNGLVVPSRVVDLPAAGAIIIFPRTPSQSRTSPASAGSGNVAALVTAAAGRLHER